MADVVFMVPSPSGWLALDRDQLDRALARGARFMPPPNTTSTPTGTTPEEMLLNAKEAAALLRMPEKTLYRQAKAGKLAAVRVGRFYRFRRSDLLAAGATAWQTVGR
jgi:excisionase family DNA binding protein